MSKPFKTLTLVSAAAFVLAAGNTYGQAFSGVFGSGVELTGTGAGARNNGTKTIYPLNTSGTDSMDLPPVGSTAMLSAAAFGTDAAPTPNLGVFTTSNSLILNGGSILTYQGGTATDTDAVNGAMLNYQIEDAAINYFSGFTAVNLPFNASGIGGAASSMRFSTEAFGKNLLAGLAPGTYTINIYNSSNFTETNTSTGTAVMTAGTNYDSNSNADYGATFTVVQAVVPEPSTWAMMLGGVGMLIGFQRRLRRNA